LRELQPEAFTDRHEVRWDPVSRKVLAERLVIFRDLVLRREALAVPPPEQAAVLLAKAVREGKCPLTHWDDAVESWIVRLNCLAAWCPEYELPPILPDDRLALLEQICLGGYTYKEIKDRAVAPVVHAWLSSAQRSLLDRMAPDRFELPGGRQARLVYKEGKEPVLAAKIQDLFGLLEAPKVAGGKVEVTIEVLAPNMRAVQMTRDLKNFWKETYPQIKPELARRYPKHRWI
jgi:ATP-dependent helicase HrpB